MKGKNTAAKRKILIRYKDNFFNHEYDKILQQLPTVDVASPSLAILRMKPDKALSKLLEAGTTLMGGWTA